LNGAQRDPEAAGAAREPLMTVNVVLDRPEEGIAILTLNRPASANALNSDLVESLHTQLEAIATDRSIRAVVLTGAGRAFCSGADLKGYGGQTDHQPGEKPASVESGFAVQVRLSALVLRLRSLPQPVIAAVNGAACGGGLALALGCDVRLAAPAAKFNVAFVKVALSGCDMGVSWLMPRLIGASRAWELMLTGRMIDASEAQRIGLVSRVTAVDGVVAAAIEVGREIRANTPWGIRMTKEVCWAQLEVGSLQAGIDLENRTQILSSMTGEHAAWVQGFLAGTRR
jgi:enoyl-CoA hydratase